MAAIELSPISEHLSDDEVDKLELALAEAKASPLDVDEQAQTVLLDGDIDDDLFAELLDRLELHDANCDIYVPPDFEEVISVGEYRIGSAHMLLLVLEELKDELFVEGLDEVEGVEGVEEDEEEEEEESDYEEEGPLLDDEIGASTFDFKEKQMRLLWKLMQLGAKTCVKQGVCMFLIE
jgi:hypothetical protein